MNEDLKAYLDKELPADRRVEIESALERDPALRAELEQLRSISESLRGYVAMPQAQGFERLASRLQKPPVGRPWWTRPLPLTASLLAVVAIGAVGTRQVLQSQANTRERSVAMMSSAPSPASYTEGQQRSVSESYADAPSAGNQQVQKTGQALLLVVNDVARAEKAVEKLASGLKGSTTLTGDREDDHLALRIVVPQEKVAEARKGLSKLGSLKQSSQAEMESSVDDEDSVVAIRTKSKELQRPGLSKAERDRIEKRIALLEEEQRGIAEGRLVEIRLTISARSRGVP